jgi:DNA polymerase I-like protein with 3'-5' exonuclease and polymerase domains
VRTPEAKAIRDAFLKDAPVVLQNMDYSPFEARWAAELRRKEKK